MLTANNADAQDIERMHIVKQMDGTASLTDDAGIGSVGSLLTWNGYRTDEGGRSGFRGTLAPKLYSDPNVNGGYLGTSFTLNGLQFTVDPDFQAEQDLVFGLHLNSEAFVKIGVGRTLRLSADFSLGKTSRHGLVDRDISLCSLNQIAKQTYFDACYGERFTGRSLGTASSTKGSLAISRMFLSQRAVTSLSVKVSHDAGESNSVSSMQLTARALTDLGLLGELYVASNIDNLALNGYRTLGMSVQSKLIGATTKISVEATRSKDGVFFGTLRTAETVNVKLSRKFRDLVTVAVGYQNTNASVDLFSSDNITFSMAITPIRF
jgi:hypothetical protein